MAMLLLLASRPRMVKSWFNTKVCPGQGPCCMTSLKLSFIALPLASSSQPPAEGRVSECLYPVYRSFLFCKVGILVAGRTSSSRAVPGVGRFFSEILNRRNIGKTPDELVELWNVEHPDDPVG
jgi:hypothetical protein